MNTGDVKQRFGTAIRNQRAELRLSQEELADRAGLHRTYISDVERGARNLSLESIEKLADALKLSISKLFQPVANGKANGQPVEILLVEDTPSDVQLTRRAFKKARLVNPIHVVNDGQEALDFLFARGSYTDRRGKALPGVILLDLGLPKIDGLGVLREIKQDEATRKIPVIVLTVSPHPKDQAECRKLGIETYIVKPVDFRKFSELIPTLQLEWTLGSSMENPRESALLIGASPR